MAEQPLMKFGSTSIAYNEWLYVFGFATHILSFKAQRQLAKLTYTTCYQLAR